MWKLLVRTLLLVGTGSRLCGAVCPPVYGGEPCTFLPAPPGRTPPCARPGDTFCEHVDYYPMQHIRYLIDKWSYDYSTLFTDETSDKFTAYFAQPDYTGYNGIPHSGPYPEPIYIPRPKTPPTPALPGNKYIPPPGNHSDSSFAGYPDRRPATPRYQPAGNYLPGHGPQQHYFAPAPGFHPHHDPNAWWRYTRDSRSAGQLHGRAKRSSTLAANATAASSSQRSVRTKRQTLGAQALCQTRTQYIMPEAAMNTRGNWMYVVNLQQQDQYTQLVNAEVCNPTTQSCSGLCNLPAGYTSRCEQKYVQKRLVALESSGQTLYTDMFWIPSCCVCMISAG